MSELLTRYLDGELSETEKEMVEKQLAEKKELRDELENLQLARDAIKYYGLSRKWPGCTRKR